MKTLRNTALLILFSAGFAQAQITVQGEPKLNTDFRKYKTFSWVRADRPSKHLLAYSYEEYAPVDPAASADKASRKEMRKRKKDGKVVVYSYLYTLPSPDSLVNNVLIRSVDNEMEGRGYRRDDLNPDLLLSYKIFDQSSKIKGYDQGPTQVGPGEQMHQPDDTISYSLRPGTVLVSILDAKNDNVIWEGYASGVAQDNDIINDKTKVKEAVNLIFKKYIYRADKYSRGN